MAEPARTAIAVEPSGTRRWLEGAVEAGGGQVVAPGEAGALVWGHHAAPDRLATLLADHGQLAWVQLPWAGVEPYVEVIGQFADRRWTCGKGVYAEPVAEHALTLVLAGLRHIAEYARASEWGTGQGRNLLGARVVVLGGGGITESFLRLLGPFGCDVTVVRQHLDPLPGATRVVGPDGLDEALAGADVVVLALALTPSTTGILDARRIGLLPSHAWIVNVARGRHIVTDALAQALADETIGGAALDVTEPEPLPAGHPLWTEPRCLITPHTANTVEMAEPLLRTRVAENVRRWIAGEDLLGPVDPGAGY
jgi:phosphoglycerate dehydrogenase-like enzyme